MVRLKQKVQWNNFYIVFINDVQDHKNSLNHSTIQKEYKVK